MPLVLKQTNGTGVVPVPLRGTVRGLPVASSVKTRFACRRPFVVGAKAILTMQLAPAARKLRQVWEMVKSEALVPVICGSSIRTVTADPFA